MISCFFVEGGRVEIDCSECFEGVSSLLPGDSEYHLVVFIYSICFVVSIGLSKGFGEILHKGVVDGSEIFEMF